VSVLPVIDDPRVCADLDEDCSEFNSAEALHCWRSDPETGVCPLID
jgi:hypothetical protein